MRILVACEESQAVCKEFRMKGHEAYSCDLEPCSGGCPQWHIRQNVLPLLNGNCEFYTCDGARHFISGEWDMILAFPPCTYLTNTGNAWFNVQKYGQRAMNRLASRDVAAYFFMRFVNADCEKIAIENPIGHMSTRYRKPNQIIHPYMFGDAERKATCLWLKGLPELVPTNIVEPKIIAYKNGKGTDSPWHMETMGLPPEQRAKMRSKTFPGIARAMAEQWSD
ncbi:MAG: DNA cytosine methyltransferase [Roseburia sp.]|nr:DNA cytosine methyltransferase [Roseburia sp.]